MTARETIRFSVSLPATLLAELDRRIVGRGYDSRSEFVRDLIRARLVEEAWAGAGSEVHGVLTIIYDHHRRGLTDKLHQVQHHRFVHILCTQHVHLDHDHCLETIVLRGTPGEIERMALEIGGLKGVSFAELTRTAVVDD
ncbi:MAG: nickel-responsive transcriptional regulator NikR [Candidatus Latescibacteria bacterium]|nr:nickel-responsive transcriptional regulator NikR [Candidatus Latescibacterota bacterium]